MLFIPQSFFDTIIFTDLCIFVLFFLLDNINSQQQNFSKNVATKNENWFIFQNMHSTVWYLVVFATQKS